MTEDSTELEKDKISGGKDMQIESNVNKKKKNIIMMEKFIDYSSQEFIERIIYMTKKLDKETLDFIFLEIEKELQAKIPEEVKIVVKTVINTNIEMIRENCSEKGITK